MFHSNYDDAESKILIVAQMANNPRAFFWNQMIRRAQQHPQFDLD
jgi:hypothetical protein